MMLLITGWVWARRNLGLEEGLDFRDFGGRKMQERTFNDDNGEDKGRANVSWTVAVGDEKNFREEIV